MPTLQITPDTSHLLQHVADTLAKSRKMVIITGAGISTNSGIPDFRSENGLYSLIQDQFERAEANVKTDSLHQIVRDDTIAHETTSAKFQVSERPTKRRRTSGTDHQTVPSPCASPPSTAPPVPSHSSRRVTRSQATAPVTETTLPPTIPRHLTQDSVDSSPSHDSSSIFSDQLPSCESSQTEDSIVVVSDRHFSPCTTSHTPRKSQGPLTSSSPLSSPPPILFDPYENANSLTDSSSHDDSDCSDTSETDDTQQSLDFFSSHASTSNLRNMKGRDLFDCNIWSDPLKTSVFYRFATSLRQRVKEVEPTVTHRFIAQMRDVGKLARVYTQNIDEIEKKIGLSTDLKHGVGNRKRKSLRQQPSESDKEQVTESLTDTGEPGSVAPVHTPQTSEDSSQPKPRLSLSPDKGVECVFLHGSLHALRCFVCGKLCDWDEGGRESCTLSGEQPECPHCAGATAARQERGKRALGIGKLRPDIVLYGEEHPQSDLISPIVQHDLAAGPDLLLVLGTSLRVHGLKVMVKEFAKAVHKKGGKVVFINFTKPSESAWGDVLDYWIEWDCDAWVEDLKTRKPRLWLSPDERLELGKQKRETLAEKKRETLKKREGLNEKKRESPGDKKPHPPEQIKARPPPKNPVAMRNDYHCGAYVVWDIFQALAKIGGRPFDNLGYVPPASDPDTAAVPSLAKPIDTNSPGEAEMTPAKDSKPQRRPRKPPARRLPRRAQGTLGQSRIDSQDPVKDEPSKPSSSLPRSAIQSTSIVVPEPILQTTTSIPTSKPLAKTKKSRKSAPMKLGSNGNSARKQKSGNRSNKSQEKHTGKDRYLKAARELGRSRKTPSSGHPAIVHQWPTTPSYTSVVSELHHPCPRPIPRPGPFEGRAIVDEDARRHSASPYLLQYQRILPLPSSAHHSLPVSATRPHFAPEEPIIPPLNVNWEHSPPLRIPTLEIFPFVGPVSPLADKRSSSSKIQFPYSMHHSTQPIYSDSLVGISRQFIHKSPWHVEASDDNTPSPSEQLHREAANQQWQMRRA